jgi:hypothetical protein
MPKYTLNKFPKGKINTDPGFGNDLLMEFLTLHKQVPIESLGDLSQKKPDSLEDIYFSDNEDEPSERLLQISGEEDMVEKGANIQVINVFPKGATMSVEPITKANLTGDISIIRDQVNDYPSSFVLKPDADPMLALQNPDMDAEKFNVVRFFAPALLSVGTHNAHIGPSFIAFPTRFWISRNTKKICFSYF